MKRLLTLFVGLLLLFSVEGQMLRYPFYSPPQTTASEPELRGVEELWDGHTAAWYVYDTLVSVTDGYVTQWDDISGNGRHLLPVAADGSLGTATNRPAWNATNGIIFDGVDDAMKALFEWGTYGTIYVVARQISWTNNDVLFGYHGTESAAPIRVTQAGSSPALVLRMGAASGISNSNLSVGQWAIIRLRIGGENPLSGDLVINETTPTTSTGTGTMVSTGILIGAANAPAPAVYRWGNIAFYEIIYRDVLDPTEDDEIIFNYLYDTYFE